MCTHSVDGNDKKVRVKFAFQCRQRPNSYRKGQETIGAKRRLDSQIGNEEIEMYTLETDAIVITGLLMKVEL